jgi:alpha-tubulin suppressor-like RCC1 family protein
MPPRKDQRPRPFGRTRRPGALTAGGLALTLAATVTAGLAVPAAASARAAGSAAAGRGESVIGWGANEVGELGNGTTTDASVPVFAKLPARFRYTTVRSSATSVALTTTGRVYGWGNNAAGQVGDGTTTNRLVPVRASKLNGVKVTAVRESGLFTMVLTSAGKVLAWGDNSFGELGDGTANSRLTPAQVKIPKGATITAISAGYEHALALTKSGRVLTWGANDAGQLGDGTFREHHEPIQVGTDADWESVSAGQDHTCAVKLVTGALYCWGGNATGQLGDNTAWRTDLELVP